MTLEPLDENNISEPSPPAIVQADFDRQVDLITDTLKYFAGDYPLVELRAMAPEHRVLSGYFNNLSEAAQQAAVLDLDGYSVF